MRPSAPALSQQAATLIREAADSLPALISYVGADERYRFANRAYSDWFGREVDTIVGRTMLEVIGPDAYAALHPHITAALSGETVRFEAHAKYRDGGPRDIDATYTPRRSPSGEVIGFYVLVQDITERKRIERELEANRALLSALLESVADGYAVLDTDWRILVFNAASERMLRRSRAEVLGKIAWEAFPGLEESPFGPMLKAAMAGASPDPIEAFLVGSAHRRLDARATPLAGGGLTVAFTDVTERYDAEQARQTSERAAREQLQELEAIYESTPVGLAFLTNDLRYIRVNRRLAEMNGVPLADHIGRSVRDVIPQIADQIEQIKARLDAGEDIVSYEVTGETWARPGRDPGRPGTGWSTGRRSGHRQVRSAAWPSRSRTSARTSAPINSLGS